jgi:HAD superfamily hydrolase (TIGR01490 family)
MPLVFFDLDGTLIKGPSSEKRFFFFLLRGANVGWRQLAAFLYFGLIWYPRLHTVVWKKNKAYLSGLKKETVGLIAEQFVTESLLPDLRNDVRRRLEDHQERGDIVVLLTGAPDIIATPIADYLNISHVVSTVCDIAKGYFTSNPPQIHPFGIAKLEIARQMCSKFNTTLDCCWAYADSVGDSDLMSAVSFPVAVYPDRRLRKIAERGGWGIIG